MKPETNIHTKLLAFQKLNISVIKDGKNPHFKSKYATLNEVLDKVKKPLNDLGVVIIFSPDSEGLKTSLYDTESGTEVSSFMKYVDCGNAQKLLSCNTYFRRGSLVSLLGLEDEDDDGNIASAPIPQKVSTPEPAKLTLAEACAILKAAKTLDELKANWKLIGAELQKHPSCVDEKNARKKELSEPIIEMLP